MQSKHSKSLIGIFLLVLLLILLGGAALLLIGKNPQLLTSTSLSDFSLTKFFQKSPSPTPPPSDSNIVGTPITADWKTYKNEKFGFSFNYPSEYSVQNLSLPLNTITITLANPTGKQIVIEAITQFAANSWQYYQDKTHPDTGVSFPNQSTWGWFYLNGEPVDGQPISLRAQAENNGKLYSVTLSESRMTILTLLSSFTFTK